eukprot:CCRYP_015819-RA/>CCRYP_015819-RA protein AED:0.41 eAED:0.38 QI:0/0/0/1/0/0/4/0/399
MKWIMVHTHTTIDTGNIFHHLQRLQYKWHTCRKQCVNTTTLAKTIQYIHQCLFSPIVDTFCKVINNDQLIGFPHITSAQVHKYLPESTATVKGHLRRVQKHTRSTTKMRQTKLQVIEHNYRPTINTNVKFELFIGATIAEQNDGTVYTDQTGAFPQHKYRSNAILVRAIKDQTDKSLTAAFHDVYKYLTKRGFQPKLYVMDNQCSKAVKKYIITTKATIQLSQCFRKSNTNMEEHWLSGMGTLDPNCPIQLWCQFIEQGQDTINLLCISQFNPKLSTYAVLEEQFNFDKTPLAPVGTRALILLDPRARKTWQNHAFDAWYDGPVKNHYRNYCFFHSIHQRLSHIRHMKMPAIEPVDTIRLAAQDLITTIQTFSKAPLNFNLQHTAALRQLADIFATNTS